MNGILNAIFHNRSIVSPAVISAPVKVLFKSIFWRYEESPPCIACRIDGELKGTIPLLGMRELIDDKFEVLYDKTYLAITSGQDSTKGLLLFVGNHGNLGGNVSLSRDTTARILRKYVGKYAGKKRIEVCALMYPQQRVIFKSVSSWRKDALTYTWTGDKLLFHSRLLTLKK